MKRIKTVSLFELYRIESRIANLEDNYRRAAGRYRERVKLEERIKDLRNGYNHLRKIRVASKGGEKYRVVGNDSFTKNKVNYKKNELEGMVYRVC